jgi:hypothetical protein
MKRIVLFGLVGMMTCLIGGNEADGRGFGGFRGGGGGWGGGGSWGHSSSFSGSRSDSFGRSGFDSFGGSRSSSFSGSRSSSYGGWDHSSSASSSRSGSAYAGGGRAAGTSSYDRSYAGSRGGSVEASGERGVATGPRGTAAGSSRDVTATGAGGRSYSSSSQHGYAVGPYGRTVGGAEGSRTVSGAHGTASSSWQSAFAGSGHMSTDLGLAHYSSAGAVHSNYATAFHSHSQTYAQAGFVRNGFGYYNCFHTGFYAAHPNCWTATGWAAGAAWTAASWDSLASWCSLPAMAPITYNYGDNVVLQDNSVYVNGQDVGTPQQYTQQATAIADAGQKTEATPEQEWKPLGVFALVQGDQTNSNNVFQLAVSKDGVVRGNYYDGVMDVTTPVYGSVDKKTQRAAWTIDKKNDRVFDAGIENLTKDEAPVLVHLGKDKVQQWMLVRMQQKKDGE